jgi:hypothetical protein
MIQWTDLYFILFSKNMCCSKPVIIVCVCVCVWWWGSTYIIMCSTHMVTCVLEKMQLLHFPLIPETCVVNALWSPTIFPWHIKMALCPCLAFFEEYICIELLADGIKGPSFLPRSRFWEILSNTASRKGICQQVVCSSSSLCTKLRSNVTTSLHTVWEFM